MTTMVLAQAADGGFDHWFSEHGIEIVAILVATIALTVGLSILLRRFRRRLEGNPSLTQEINLQRIATLTGALSTTGIVVIWVVAVLLVLAELNVPLGPFFASAGIAGIALGFGAQSIVRDTLSGFFILLENQFGVSDVVSLQTANGVVDGKVESLSFRVTTLRAFDGTLHTVPNGNIMFVSNKSRGWARAIVDLRLAYGEDLDRIREILEELFEEIRTEETMRDWIREGPSMLGIERLADSAQVVRIVADTRPSKRVDVERALRERIARKLAEAGVQVPVGPTMTPGTPPASG
jgi:moderate conductance mechanosensitive channel